MSATPDTPNEPVAFLRHDHSRCREAALARVEDDCREKGLRLTDARRCVLEALLESHHAMSAYELLDRLSAEGLGNKPPIVYRALDFLVRNGFVHRIERLSAFVACTHGDGVHSAAFLICRSCGQVAEACGPGVAELVSGLSDERGFAPERVGVEIEGLCPACRASEA